MQIQKTNSSPNFNGALVITTYTAASNANSAKLKSAKVLKISKAQYEEARRLVNTEVKSGLMQKVTRKFAQKMDALIRCATGESVKKQHQQRRVRKTSYGFAYGDKNPPNGGFFAEFSLKNPPQR